mmetsp:Transcript_15279/g.18696  ORF Transcript_15279/g.18696 Transcript_15279/m.18696 type:complete len:269 (-) Transcript_15279:27-833(-)
MSHRRGKKKDNQKKKAKKVSRDDEKDEIISQQQNKKGRNKGGPKNDNKNKQKKRKKGKTKGGPSDKQQKLTKQRLDKIIRSKFQNPNKQQPSSIESQICQYLVDLEASQKDLKPHLRELGIVKAQEITVKEQKQCIVIFVPYRQHIKWKKIQDRIIRELEKKFSAKEVIIISERKIMKLYQIDPNLNIPRPRSQTITAVHEAILDDVVYPTKIVGKRTRFKIGGKRLLKVYLDPKDSKDIETKIPTFEVVYKKLTKKTVKFVFPRYII